MDLPTHSSPHPPDYSRCVSHNTAHVHHTQRAHAVYTNSLWYMTDTQQSVAQLSPAQLTPMYPVHSSHGQDHQDYPSPAPSDPSPGPRPHQQLEQHQNYHQSSVPFHSSSNDCMGSPFNQIESSIGPTRPTRRQASLKQGLLGRRASLSSNYPARGEHDSLLQPPLIIHDNVMPRVESPSDRQSDRSSLHATSPHMGPVHLQSPYHPGTPTSMTSPYSPYEHGDRSRTRSGSNFEGRVHSPALSAASVLTTSSRGLDGSVRAESSKAGAARPPVKEKHKKHRLRDIDRKNICLYSEDHHNARQEDIAVAFGVERSTISKILKDKQRWMSISGEDELDQTAKHRPSKFPEIEEEMMKHLQHWTDKGINITDQLIRSQALAIAKKLTIGPEKFKGSSGWIENFKHRQDVRRGEWHRAIRNLPPNYNTSMSDVQPIVPHTPIIIAYDQRMHLTESDTQGLQLKPSGSQEPEVPLQRLATSESLHQVMTTPAQWPDQSQNDEAQPIHGHMMDASHQQEHSPEQHMESTHQHQHQQQSSDEVQTQSQQPAYNVSVQAYAQPLYGPGVAAAHSQHPTIAEAEDAINVLITYLDTAGRGIIKHEERETLGEIKCALFRAASGIPYDRP